MGLYNRYMGNSGKFVRVDDDSEPPRAPQARTAATESRPQPVPTPPTTQTKRAAKPFSLSALGEQLGLGSLSPLLGKLETADLLLIAVLLLMYLEKKDDELLIALAAFVVLSLN